MILLVDDDKEIANVVLKTLRSLGYVGIAINDPIQALAMFSAVPDRFEAVIVDEIMPGMRGTELTRQLMKAKDDIPVVLLTGYGSLIPVEQALASGIRETLTKPLVREELKEVLDKILAAGRPPRP
jgi:CheY-like chemotaxis protein